MLRICYAVVVQVWRWCVFRREDWKGVVDDAGGQGAEVSRRRRRSALKERKVDGDPNVGLGMEVEGLFVRGVESIDLRARGVWSGDVVVHQL